MIAFALEPCQSAAEAPAKLLPPGDPAHRHIAAASVALIVNAFIHKPMRRLLEQLADRLGSPRARRSARPGER